MPNAISNQHTNNSPLLTTPSSPEVYHIGDCDEEINQNNVEGPKRGSLWSSVVTSFRPLATAVATNLEGDSDKGSYWRSIDAGLNYGGECPNPNCKCWTEAEGRSRGYVSSRRGFGEFRPLEDELYTEGGAVITCNACETPFVPKVFTLYCCSLEIDFVLKGEHVVRKCVLGTGLQQEKYLRLEKGKSADWANQFIMLKFRVVPPSRTKELPIFKATTNKMNVTENFTPTPLVVDSNFNMRISQMQFKLKEEESDQESVMSVWRRLFTSCRFRRPNFTLPRFTNFNGATNVNTEDEYQVAKELDRELLEKTKSKSRKLELDADFDHVEVSQHVVVNFSSQEDVSQHVVVNLSSQQV